MDDRNKRIKELDEAINSCTNMIKAIDVFIVGVFIVLIIVLITLIIFI